MAFGRGGNGNRGGILRHWKLILGILVVLYLIGSMSSRTGRGTSSHERPGGGQQDVAAATEQAEPAQEEEPSQEAVQEPQKEAPEEKQEAQAEVSQSAPQEENAADGIRPEFKEAMDAYVKFFDDYCDFCVKFSQSKDDPSMMIDYLTWMTDYSETMEKIDEIDEESLTPAEDAYYLEATLRIEKKCLEAMQALGE